MRSPIPGGTVAGTTVDGDLVDALREQRAALEQSLKNAGSDADARADPGRARRRRCRNRQRALGVRSARRRRSKIPWRSRSAGEGGGQCANSTRSSSSGMSGRGELHPGLNSTLETNSRGTQSAARQRDGVAAAGTLWATVDVGSCRGRRGGNRRPRFARQSAGDPRDRPVDGASPFGSGIAPTRSESTSVVGRKARRKGRETTSKTPGSRVPSASTWVKPLPRSRTKRRPWSKMRRPRPGRSSRKPRKPSRAASTVSFQASPAPWRRPRAPWAAQRPASPRRRPRLPLLSAVPALARFRCAGRSAVAAKTRPRTCVRCRARSESAPMARVVHNHWCHRSVPADDGVRQARWPRRRRRRDGASVARRRDAFGCAAVGAARCGPYGRHGRAAGSVAGRRRRRLRWSDGGRRGGRRTRRRFLDENIPGGEGASRQGCKDRRRRCRPAKGLANKVVEGAKKALSDPKVLLDQFPADGGAPGGARRTEAPTEGRRTGAPSPTRSSRTSTSPSTSAPMIRWSSSTRATRTSGRGLRVT